LDIKAYKFGKFIEWMIRIQDVKHDKKLLEKLGNLELECYAGVLSALRGYEEVYHRLFKEPVEVKVVAPREACDERLYEICLRAQGKHDKFMDLRHKVVGELGGMAQDPGWNFLTVSFDGLYIGEPEDLVRHRADADVKTLNPQIFMPLYPVKGLGIKAAEVTFL